MFSPLSTRCEHDRHGGGGAQSSTSCSKGKEKIGFQAPRMRVLTPMSTVKRLLQQDHAYFKATPSDSATP